MLLDSEVLSKEQMDRRLRGLGARLLRDKSSKNAFVYMTNPGYWARVVAAKNMPGFAVVEYHDECPCSIGG